MRKGPYLQLQWQCKAGLQPISQNNQIVTGDWVTTSCRRSGTTHWKHEGIAHLLKICCYGSYICKESSC